MQFQEPWASPLCIEAINNRRDIKNYSAFGFFRE